MAVDYEALARKHGGVDYAALAAKHGAVAPSDSSPTAAAARPPSIPNVAAHPLMDMLQSTGITPQNVVPMITPTATALGGAVGMRLGGPRGAAFGGGVVGGLGRIAERGVRSASGMPPPQSITEMIGGQNVVDALPPELRMMIDLAEQASIGAMMEGIPSYLFGVPGRAAKPSAESLDPRRPQTIPGAVQRRTREAVDRDLAKLEEQAILKRRSLDAAGEMTPAERASVEAERVASARGRTRERIAARDIGPEIEKAAEGTKAARQAAGAAKGAAVKEASEGGVTISIDDMTEEIMSRQQELFGQSANPKRLRKQIRSQIAGVLDKHTAGAVRLPRGASKVLDAKGNPIPMSPIVLTARQADDLARGLGESLTAQFAGVERGKTPKGGLANFTHRAVKDLLRERVSGLADLNEAARAAIKEDAQVQTLAAGQPVETVKRLRETQAVRGAESSARSGMRPRPAEEAVRQAQRERKAAAAARANYLTASAWNPHVYLSGGVRATTPSMGGIRLGASRAVEHPAVSGSLRYSPAAINLLLRMLMSNTNEQPAIMPPMPEGPFSSGALPDSLRNR